VVMFEYDRVFDTVFSYIRENPAERIRLYDLAMQGFKVV
jgi:hypothetical protein